jgi:hypothetical protein
VAWLQKDKQYTLKIGRTTLPSSVYDLEFFKDSIPENPSVLIPGSAVLIAHVKPHASPTFFTSRVIIWVALILVIGVLGVMSFRLIKDANAKIDNDEKSI